MCRLIRTGNSKVMLLKQVGAEGVGGAEEGGVVWGESSENN